LWDLTVEICLLNKRILSGRILLLTHLTRFGFILHRYRDIYVAFHSRAYLLKKTGQTQNAYAKYGNKGKNTGFLPIFGGSKKRLPRIIEKILKRDINVAVQYI